jgi:hypothetical protein
MRINTIAVLILTLAGLMGCASTPMAPKEQDKDSKTFKAPHLNLAGIYIYRNSSFGAALKKRVSIDGVVIGETAKNTFFHKEITPGAHTLATESEFGDNVLTLNAEAGKNHYFRQYIKMGAFVGGANIEAVSEEEGQNGVLECEEAYSPDLKLNIVANTSAASVQSKASDVVINHAVTNDTSEKFRELQALRKEGLITEAEFKNKKKQLLEKF